MSGNTVPSIPLDGIFANVYNRCEDGDMTDILENVRIDKWLWAVRLCKTRSLAANLCRTGKVSVNSVVCKPSKAVKSGDVIDLDSPYRKVSVEVTGILDKRVGASLAVENYRII